MYSGIKFTNNASTQLTQTLLATDTVLYVGTNGASIFPKLDTTDDYFLLTLFDINKNREVVKCTARTDDSCTVVRAQEGTTARTFQAGTLVELRLTADSVTKVAEDASVTKPHASTDPAAYGQATAQVYSHVKLTDNFELGTQAINGIICTPYALQQAVNRLTSVADTFLITSSTTYIVPETGTYTVTCVGGGGTGGKGRPGFITYDDTKWPSGENGPSRNGGAGGAGGGAGQTKTSILMLTKGTSIQVIVGSGNSGTTSFGSYVTALGGGAGSSTNVGVSYGSPASLGRAGEYKVSLAGSNWGWAYGGAGGAGGISVDGVYGNGGTGGRGGDSGIFPPFEERLEINTDGAPGITGTQGCVKITMKLGS